MTKPALNPKTELCKVKPTNSLFFIGSGPCECEIDAADVNNMTVGSMIEGDVRAVAYRYLLARKSENITFFEARNSAIIAVVFLISEVLLFYFTRNLRASIKDEVDLSGKIILFLISLLMPLYGLLNMLPNICNAFRHKETRKASADWLDKGAEQGFFRKIEKMSYTREGILQAKSLMDELGIPEATTDLPRAVIELCSASVNVTNARADSSVHFKL